MSSAYVRIKIYVYILYEYAKRVVSETETEKDSIDQLNELPLNLGELLSLQMQARGQFAETHYDKFLNKVAQRFLESQYPDLRIRGAPWARPKVAAYNAGGSRMNAIFGTGGEHTGHHQTLAAPFRNQPKRKRGEPLAPLTGSLEGHSPGASPVS